jgi:FMN-dependent NADH-azoreductase
MKTILHISATPAAHSVTAKLADYMLETLQNKYEDSRIHTRNVFTGLDAAHQTETLSAELISELKHCDIFLFPRLSGIFLSPPA